DLRALRSNASGRVLARPRPRSLVHHLVPEPRGARGGGRAGPHPHAAPPVQRRAVRVLGAAAAGHRVGVAGAAHLAPPSRSAARTDSGPPTYPAVAFHLLSGRLTSGPSAGDDGSGPSCRPGGGSLRGQRWRW